MAIATSGAVFGEEGLNLNLGDVQVMTLENLERSLVLKMMSCFGKEKVTELIFTNTFKKLLAVRHH